MSERHSSKALKGVGLKGSESFLFYLVHYKLVVDSLFGHQLSVSTLLKDLAILEADDDVCCLDGGQAMGNHNGGSALSGLCREQKSY